MLTKEDLKALRSARYLGFHHQPNMPSQDMITCLNDHPNPYIEPYVVPVGYEITDYKAQYTSQPEEIRSCYEYLPANEVWQTIVHQLRVGDEVILHWIKDNNNGYVEGAGLHHDELALIVRRGNKSFHYLVTGSICQDNTARMIRRPW